ncbi:hypothetical protein EZJ43_08005 [Pedobacter changchengzhani]|uniref:Uncharacterized protein n=1 Tax=Pedobacter changchengzhani TaxID=2529274 RepID=A0A4R5MLG4_9SPHI|nr:hypothetical protein [Pedobacter changchengzhani]TDG36452.1 hypothetical protein EZJ43_08005 [Pedobacter changchengzhani]
MSKKQALMAYIIISLLLIANVIGDSIYKLSIAGYWSDRILFWMWFFSTIYIIKIFWKKVLTKIYFGLLITGIILSILPMMIPFFAIVLSTTGGGLHFKKQITPEYRLQIVGYGVMGRPLMELVENRGLIEKRVANTNQHVAINDSTRIAIWSIQDAKFISETDSSMTIQFSGDNVTSKMTLLKNN